MSGGNELRYFEDSMGRAQVKKLLDNKTGSRGDSEKVSGMKWLLADISKGQNASELFPDVVKLVSTTHLELKKLVYMYLVHYGDHDQACRDLNLMAINSYQKDLESKNQLVRSLALRALASIRVRDVAQIQLQSLRQAAADKSPYVRKIAAIALPKVYELDQSLKGEVTELLETLLGDMKPMVIGSAIMSVAEVCPENMALLHKHFRKLCRVLTDIDEWAQVVLLNLLMRYARANFAKPISNRSAGASSGVPATSQHSQASGENNSAPSKKSAPAAKSLPKKPAVSLNDFYGADSDDSDGDAAPTDSQSKSAEPALLDLGAGGESDHEENSNVASPAHNSEQKPNSGSSMDDDLKLFLQSAVKLMKSRNSAVVLAVARTYVHLGTANPIVLADLSDALLLELRNHREIAAVILPCVDLLARRFPERFAENYSEFFIVPTDSGETHELKLQVLSRIADEKTAPRILNELLVYLRGLDSRLICLTIDCIVRLSTRVPSTCGGAIHALLCLVHAKNSDIVTAAVSGVQRIFVRVGAPGPAVVHQLMDMYTDITHPQARSSIIWIVAEFAHLVVDDTPDFLRLCVLGFVNEPRDVKLQIQYLAMKLNVAPDLAALREPGSYSATQLRLMLQYVADLCAADQDHDVRDRAAFARYILNNSTADAPLRTDDITVSLLWQTEQDRRNAQIAAVAVHEEEDAKDEPLVMGSLSHIVGHSVLGYLPLPGFQEVSTSSSLRDKETYEQSATTTSVPDPESSSDSKSSSSDSDDSDSSDSDSDSSDSDSGTDSSSDAKPEASKTASVAEGDLLFGGASTAAAPKKHSSTESDLFADVFGTAGEAPKSTPSTAHAAVSDLFGASGVPEPSIDTAQALETSTSTQRPNTGDSDADSGSDSSSDDSSESGESSSGESSSGSSGSNSGDDKKQRSAAEESSNHVDAISDAFGGLDFE